MIVVRCFFGLGLGVVLHSERRKLSNVAWLHLEKGERESN